MMGYSVMAMKRVEKKKVTCCGRCCGRCYKSRVVGARPIYRWNIFNEGNDARDPSGLDELQFLMSVSRLPTRRDIMEEQNDECVCCPEAVKTALTEMLDVNLLKSPIFLLLALSAFFFSAGIYIPVLYIKAMAVSQNVEDRYLIWLLPNIGIGTTLGRGTSGIMLTLLPRLPALYLTTASIFFTSLMMFSYQLTAAGVIIVVMNAFYGFIFGFGVPLRSMIVIEYLGLDKLTNATGLLFVFQGTGALLGPPLAKAVVEWQGDEKWGFILAAVSFFISTIAMFPVKIVHNYRLART